MPPQLVSLGEGPNILLDKPILLIGRHQECDIQIPSRKISRRHCCIAQVNDHLVIRDLGSTNGLRVNGVRVNEGSLKSGDELVIGNFRYEVRLNAAAVAAPVPAPDAVPEANAAQAIAAGHPRPQLPPPPMPAPPMPAPFDSGDIPVPLDDPLPPVLPTNRGAPPPPLENLPNPFLPESMSLEPLSEDPPRT